MHKLTFSLLTMTSLVMQASGELLFYENFDYPAGDLAGNQHANGNTWARLSGNAFNSAVANGSLTFAPLPNFSRLGGSIEQTASSRSALSVEGLITGEDGDVVYISFLQEIGDGNINSAHIVEFWRDGTGDADTVLSFGTDGNTVAGDYGLLLDKNDPASKFIDGGFATEETRLIVIRIAFGAADADTVSLYVDPGSTEPAVPTGTDSYTNLTFETIGFGTFQGGFHKIDEIRIATSYEEAVPDFIDIEPDGMPDNWEMTNGLNVGVDDSSLDNDNDGGPDGLSNLEEYLNNTDPQDSDSDDDGLTDGEELNDIETNPLDSDTDDDEILDGEEVNEGLDGFITDPFEPDTDFDGLPDKYEVENILDPTDDGTTNEDFGPDGDPDDDDLVNIDEFDRETDPQDDDTDDDGYKDGVETRLEPDDFGEWFDESDTGTHPLIPDSDGDGLKDGDENPDSGSADGPIYNSDPNLVDSDGDLWQDGIEAAANTDPSDANDRPTNVSLLTVEQLINGGFEDSDVPTGEHDEIQGWQRTQVARTVETTGLNGGEWDNTTGAASQVAMLPFRDVSASESMSQQIIGTTSINDESHPISAVEAEGQLMTFVGRIGVQSFNGWPTAHGTLEVGLQNAVTEEWQDMTTLYTGTEEQAMTAGITADTYLGLDETNANGDSTVVTLPFTVPGGVENSGEFLLLTATSSQVNAGDQGRVTLDDVSLFLGEPPVPQAELTISAIQFNGTPLELTVEGLDITKTYLLKSSANLNDGFPNTIGTPFTPTQETLTITDPNPDPAATYYRVEESVN